MKGYDIIVLAGQSNASGYGMGPVTEEYIPNNNILLLSDCSNPYVDKDENGKDKLYINYPSEMKLKIADEPYDGKVKIGKFALFFAKSYQEKGLLKEDRKILIIDSAVAATGFARKEWGVGNVLYTRLCALTDYALALDNGDNKIVAFLWHQGECDVWENSDFSPEKRYEVHKANLNAMFDDFKNKYCNENGEDFPFFAAGFCHQWYEKNKIQSDAILRATREIIEYEGGIFIDTRDLLSNNQMNADNDEIHFCRESLHILGKRYFEAYLQFISRNQYYI